VGLRFESLGVPFAGRLSVDQTRLDGKPQVEPRYFETHE
jgi:hypothetical protein